MQDNSRAKFVLGALAALIIVAALWRVLSYEENPAARAAAVKKGKTSPALIQTPPQPVSKYEELLGPSPAEQSAAPGLPQIPHRGATTRPDKGPVFITQKQPYPASTQTPRKPYPARRYTAETPRMVDTNFYTPDRGPSMPATAAPAVTRPGSSASPSVSWNNTSAAMQEERAARVMSPFGRTSKSERDRRNAQWAKLSAAIDRAVLQALMPKSKKEALIEKYAPKSAQNTPADPVMQSSGLTGAFAPVGQALSAQKQEIMKNFASSFGANAAQQAGGIMDSFARELGSALNTPGLTQAQAAKRAKEISKKYQDKMNKLAEQKQEDKFMADRLAQDTAQKQALHELYPQENLSAQINQYIDTASQQLRELIAKRDLSPEEQEARYAQIEQEKREHIQHAILQGGQSLNPLYGWEQKQNEQALAQLKTKIENGEVESIARKATPKETRVMQENVKVQRQGLEKGLLEDPHLGKQAVEEVKPILDNYENQLNQLYQTELSPDERQEQEVALLKTVNRNLLQKRMEQVERMDLPEAQKQQALDELQQAYNNIK